MTPFPKDKTGLLIIDPVNDFLSDGGKAYPLVKDVVERVGTVPNLKRLIEAARQAGISIFFAPMAYTEQDFTTWKHLTGIHKAMYENRMFEAGSWGADYHPELRPRAGEIVILPHKNIDVFATTDLDTQLRQHQIEHLIVGGMSATLCVESTLRTGMERGYHVTVVKDATAAVGWDAYKAVVEYDYPLITHQVLTTEEAVNLLGELRAPALR